jgi:hypothetical protein
MVLSVPLNNHIPYREKKRKHSKQRAGSVKIKILKFRTFCKLI